MLRLLVTSAALAICLSGCGPNRGEAVADIEALFPTFGQFEVTGLYRTDACEYVAYARGAFVTDPASPDCDIRSNGAPRQAIDAQARADLDAIYAESQQVASRLQSAFPQYDEGGSIVRGEFAFQWDRVYIYEPGWTELPPDDSQEVTAVNDDWCEVSYETSLELFE